VEQYGVTLTSEDRSLLRPLVSSGTAAARKLTHARLLLLADASPDGPARAEAAIAEALGVGASTSHRGRQRLGRESFDAALRSRPSPPRPQQVKGQGAIEHARLDLACSDPPKGRSRGPFQRWTAHLVRLGKRPSVSRETVRQALKKTRVPQGG
jgi:hypothetical protein